MNDELGAFVIGLVLGIFISCVVAFNVGFSDQLDSSAAAKICEKNGGYAAVYTDLDVTCKDGAEFDSKQVRTLRTILEKTAETK